MPVRFRERMSGKVRTLEGDRGFSFTVAVDGPSFWGAWGRDALRLTGRASLEGVVFDAPLLPGSTLEIGLPFRRKLAYSVSFRDATGRCYRFFGEKTIRYLTFLLTIRKLDGTLFADGQHVGPATLYFDFTTLPAFIGSFRLQEAPLVAAA